MEKPRGYEQGMLESVDRFAQIAVQTSRDDKEFMRKLGDEYHIPPKMNAVKAFRQLLLTIADNVCEELRTQGGAE